MKNIPIRVKQDVFGGSCRQIRIEERCSGLPEVVALLSGFLREIPAYPETGV